MVTIPKNLTLEAFSQLPETKPASEFINARIYPKSMPQGEHSRLQTKLSNAINQITEPEQIAYAFSELRCNFGGASLVPDIAVFRWTRIPRNSTGRIANRIETYPDWVIEILSPDQSQNKVLAKLLHCIEHGSELGWLIDPQDASILSIFADQRIQLFHDQDFLPVLSGIELSLTTTTIMNWLIF